jgi:ABC-type polysaccharide/polyol phosphate transport system ATPase subunit
VTAVDYALDIVHLAKSFRRQTLVRPGYTTIKSAIVSSTFGRLKKLFSSAQTPKPTREHNVTHAIQDLTIRVPQGSSVGIIGRNGSGKSTLLKLITGIYKPDVGHVKVNGRVAALIELGAGFHPDFTGRENLLLGGVMHGLTRTELEKLLPTIIEFAELKDVIDDPVRTYSSGMFMRLGFSLAVHTDPDILIIDEVLAVGDAAFISKCKERIAKLRREGKTLLLVSHDLEAVERWCDEAVWLHRGKVADRGDPRRVIDHYREFIEKGEEEELKEAAEKNSAEAASEPSKEPHTGPADNTGEKGAQDSSSDEGSASVAAGFTPQRWGSREVEITKVRLVKSDDSDHLLFHPDDALTIEVEYVVRDEAHVDLKDLFFGIGITRSDGVLIHGTNTDIDRAALKLSKSGIVRYSLARLGLVEGNYRLDVAAHRRDGYPYDYHQGLRTFAVRWAGKQVGVYLPQSEWASLTEGKEESSERGQQARGAGVQGTFSAQGRAHGE